MKLLILYRRRWGLFYLPVVALALLVIWWAANFPLPLPPRTLTFVVGDADSTNAQTARRYRDQLERMGLALDIQIAAGQTAALQRLGQSGGEAPAGFGTGMQSGAAPGVQALAIVGKQPVWVFTRLPTITQIAQLKGASVGTDALGTPSADAAVTMLAQAQLRPSDYKLVSLDAARGSQALQDGAIDAAIVVASEDGPVVQQLARTPGIQMLGIDRATALIAREPRLRPFVLPQGAIELRGDIPSRDLTMAASMNHLLVRSDMHPALQRLLLNVAQEIHEAPGFLTRQGEFPQLRDTDFPLSPISRAVALGERPWLERVLPYRLAQQAALFLYVVLPVLALLFLILRWIPNVFAWRVNAVLQNYYGELKFLEAEIEPTAANRPMGLRDLLSRLDAIEQQVAALQLPDRFADRWYTLREHLAAARDKLFELRAR